MLAIIGSILGLVGSLLPEVLKYFNNKEDHRHEIEMGKLQMDAMKLQGQIKLQELEAQADIEETKVLHTSAEQKLTGVRWIDALVSLYNGSVRPTLTYGFFVLYGYVKFSIIYTSIVAGADWKVLGPIIWGSEDFAVFATIMSFWFGGRFLKYALQRNGKK